MQKFYIFLWGIKESIKADIKKLGDYIQFITPLIFLIYSACFLDNHTSIVFVISFFVSIIISTLLKYIFNNPRPIEVGKPENPDLDLDWSVKKGNSFPSGHTMSAMSGGLWWFQIDIIFGIIGIILGLITGLSRIIAKAHWLRDVLTSSILSCIIYYITITYFL